MLLISEWFTQVTGFLKQYPVLFFSILGHHVGCWFWRSCLHFICCHCFVPCWIFYAKLDQNTGSHIRKLDKQFYPITYYQNLSSWVVLQLWLSREWKWYSFFFKKQVDDIYTIIWLSWYLTYIDVLSIYLTSEFSLYGKRNVVFFSFTIWSETKCKIYFNFYANYLHSVTDCKKRGGGVLLGHTLKPCVPWSHLTGLAPNCPSLTFGPKFGLASNIGLLSNLVVGNLVTS